MSTSNAELDPTLASLLERIFTLTKRLLQQEGTFAPMGVMVLPDGQTQHMLPNAVGEASRIYDHLKQRVADGELRIGAFVELVEVHQNGSKTDAVSLTVMVPAHKISVYYVPIVAWTDPIEYGPSWVGDERMDTTQGTP